MPSSCLVVITTLPTRAKARQVSQLLLKKKLAACINLIGPAESSFWWRGKIDKAREYLLFIKTRRSHFNRLRQFLERHHPYSVPEIAALPIIKGNTPYLNWIKKSI